MSGFIEGLDKLNEKDSKVRAVLRQSLSFDPGCFPPAYPYVERFLKDDDNGWHRAMHYLVAGLWASHWREGRGGQPLSVGAACADFDREKTKKLSRDDRKKMTSTERRFISLLDADGDQLPYRLRQIVSLLKDFNLDFSAMLWNSKTKTGLLNWNDDRRRTQNDWARDFYRNIVSDNDAPNNTNEEATNEDPD
ncbi:MAG: type I-E CRISPR-associated protein Cse2/CasB [Syntrophales bacterium]